MKIYSLQGYDEVSRGQLGASVFSVALSRMCFMYSTSFYTLISKCSVSESNNWVHCLFHNWSCDGAGTKGREECRWLLSQKCIQKCAFCPLVSHAIRVAEKKQFFHATLIFECQRSNTNEEADLQINLCTRGVPSHPPRKALIG